MGPTRDDFEIWKGVKSIATKLSQVHNRKIYSFILRMIPGPGTGTNLSLSSLPSQPGRCRLRHDFNVNDTKLPQHSTIQTSSFCFLSGWRYESLLLFLQVFICNQSLFPIETRAESSYSDVCGANHRQWQSASSPRPGSPGQIREDDHHGTSPWRH